MTTDVGISAYAQPLQCVLQAYDAMKRECMQLMDGAASGVEEDSVQSVLDSVERRVADPERDLAVELSKLAGCEKGLLKLASGLQQATRRGSLAAQSTVQNADDVAGALAEEGAALRIVTHPFTKSKTIAIADLDTHELVDKAGLFPSAVVATLVEAKEKLERLLIIQEKKHQQQVAAWQAHEAVLRDQLFVARRHVVMKEQLLKKFESLGFFQPGADSTAAQQNGTPSVADDTLEQYTHMKDSLRQLQGELQDARSHELVLVDKVDTLTKGYRRKCYEVTQLEKNCAVTGERLARKTTECLHQKQAAELLAQDVRAAEQSLAGVVPRGMGGLVAMARAVDHGVQQLRSFLRDPAAGVPVDDSGVFAQDMTRVAVLAGHSKRERQANRAGAGSPLTSLPSLHAGTGFASVVNMSFSKSGRSNSPKSPSNPHASMLQDGSPSSPHGRSHARITRTPSEDAQKLGGVEPVWWRLWPHVAMISCTARVLHSPICVAVLAVAARVVAWHVLEDASAWTYDVRTACGAADEDMMFVRDVLDGRETPRWNALWAPLRALAAIGVPPDTILLSTSVTVDLLVGTVLQGTGMLPAYWYLLNPLAVLSGPLSIANFKVLLHVASLLFFPTHRRFFAAVPLAVAAYLCPVTSLTLGCVCVLALDSTPARAAFLVTFAAVLGLTAGVGYLHGDAQFFASSFDECVMPRPNWGMHWYLHLEVFPSFRMLFCHVLVLLTPGIVVPYSYKLLSEPGNTRVALAACYALCVVTSLAPTFVSYAAAFTVLIASSPATLTSMNVPPRVFVWAACLCFSLQCGFVTAWLKHQSANSNFFYFVNLGWGLTLGAAVIEFASTHARLQRQAVVPLKDKAE